jgi:diadenosine tetraphosphate (Ap4A) HIT family hydrolase
LLAPAARFAWIVAGERSGPDQVFDRVVASTKSFVALPSVGSLVPGWVLIVPRRPLISMSKLVEAERAELADFRAELTGKLAREFGHKVFEFEHGPTSPGGLMGCGVDQAHMHLVPLPFDLVAAAAEEGALLSVGDRVNPWLGLPEAEYVLVRAAEANISYALYPEKPVSQLLRRKIAERLAIGSCWNYREHAFGGNARLTIEAFAGE